MVMNGGDPNAPQVAGQETLGGEHHKDTVFPRSTSSSLNHGSNSTLPDSPLVQSILLEHWTRLFRALGRS